MLAGSRSVEIQASRTGRRHCPYCANVIGRPRKTELTSDRIEAACLSLYFSRREKYPELQIGRPFTRRQLTSLAYAKNVGNQCICSMCVNYLSRHVVHLS